MPSRPLRESAVPDRDRNAEGRAENARPRDRYGRPLPRGAADELPERAEPDQVVGSVPEALEEASRLFDAHRFFEAHEFLEWIWKSDEVPEDDREFWKGVTQIAVGYTHAQRGNGSGAITLLERACRYLAPYPPRHAGVDAEALVTGAGAVIAQIAEQGPSPDLDFPAFPAR
jgi:predicted metal-dependent hydrolase